MEDVGGRFVRIFYYCRYVFNLIVLVLPLHLPLWNGMPRPTLSLPLSTFVRETNKKGCGYCDM